MPADQDKKTLMPGFRPDIDGLRAIAVTYVVGFHAFPALFPGGFVGVDIFFVISGYLITGILIGSLEQQRFSFLEFYRRRIQRIFPALLVVLVACLTIGWYGLVPEEFHDLARHALGGAAFISNVLLWHHDVYFDTASDIVPLLHLWSLGVEEQFYIIWPVALWLAWRLRLNIALVIAIIGGSSFALSCVDTFSAQVVDHLFAFGSSLTRAWELMLGGLLAYATALRKPLPLMPGSVAMSRPRIVNDALAAAGVLLLAVALVSIRSESAFPGYWALLPTVGAFLLIAAGGEAWANRTVLASRPFRFIGLVSYPLYLWHWPLLSFGRVFNGATPPAIVRVALVGAAILLASLTYQFVEKPIRGGVQRPIKAVAPLVAMLLLGILSYCGLRYDPSDYRPVLRQISDGFPVSVLPGYGPCQDPRLLGGPRLGLCIFPEQGGTDAVLIGDSHAEDKLYGLVRIDHAHRWALLGNAGCPPIDGINLYIRGAPESDCRNKSAKVIDWVDSQPAIRTVVLAFFDNYFLTTDFAADHVLHNVVSQVVIASPAGEGGSRADLFYAGLERAIARLEQAHKQVVVLIDLPEIPFMPRDCYRRQGTSECVLARSVVDARQAQARVIIARLQQAHPNILVFDPLERFCPGSLCPYVEAGHLLYEDSNHLSHYGSDRYAEVFSRWLTTH